ncbi:hypothetical protein RHMOL_Rhmol05G0009000 [Rhododendron molle]|uniref:Uncharacterized protein n=1 Tax=Rhododendron molle TaxID=49168 RepID=A0ACC0NKG2_RHOML|nr:hypothetical protein RHMOL_Rhmol05G0009000 [Rhododendron molle]
MNMEDILRNIYTDDDAPFPDEPLSSAAAQNGGVSSKTMDEVWKETAAQTPLGTIPFISAIGLAKSLQKSVD